MRCCQRAHTCMPAPTTLGLPISASGAASAAEQASRDGAQGPHLHPACNTVGTLLTRVLAIKLLEMVREACQVLAICFSPGSCRWGPARRCCVLGGLWTMLFLLQAA